MGIYRQVPARAFSQSQAPKDETGPGQTTTSTTMLACGEADRLPGILSHEKQASGRDKFNPIHWHLSPLA